MIISARVMAALGLLLAIFPNSAFAQARYCVRWVNRTDVGTPGPRVGSAAAYDSDRNVTVLFGGEDPSDGRDIFFNDTWEYDGVAWRRIIISGTVPVHRDNHKMCYDTTRRRVMMVGGRNEHGFTADAWFYTSTGPGTGTWTTMPYGGGGANFGLAFDESRGHAVLCGGIEIVNSDDPRSLEETRIWNGQDWRSGFDLPDPLDDMAIAYDSRRGAVVIQGGRTRCLDRDLFGTCGPDYMASGTYGYSTSWSPSPQPAPADFERRRYAHAMVYDRVRDRLVMFGGLTNLNGNADDIHAEYHPSVGWRSMVVAPGGQQRPPRRDRHVMVYDIARQRTVLFGGVGDAHYNDTWELVNEPASITLGTAADQEVCRGQAFRIDVMVETATGSTYQWFHNLVAIAGATAQDFVRSSVQLADTGSYYLQVTDPCGNTATGPTTTLVVHREPIISFFDNSRVEYCPGANATAMRVFVEENPLPQTYQWYKGGSPIAGATSNELLLTNLTYADTGDYRVYIGNRCGAVFSASKHVQVGVTISGQPLNTVGSVCQPTGFGAYADGVGTLQYQWRWNGVELTNDGYYSGVNSSLLQINRVLYAHEGLYDVIITDACGPIYAVTSAVARLQVTPGPEWVLRTTNGPPPRAGTSMAYDSDRQMTMLFGGQITNAAGERTSLSDFWEWDGLHWTMRSPHSSTNGWVMTNGFWRVAHAGAPVHRSHHNLVYDSTRNRLILFGGQTVSPQGFRSYLNDLWEWDGTQWIFRASNGPLPRINASMAHDSHRGITLLKGGFLTGFDSAASVIWEWDGAQWRQQATTNGPATSYSQDLGAMAYDSERRLAVFGPAASQQGDRWEFWTWNANATQWSRFTHSAGSLSGNTYGDLAYDSYRKRSVWFGGLNGSVPSNETGFFNGQMWSVLAHGIRPAGRQHQAMAYDSARRAVVMFGGDTGSFGAQEFSGQTWELIAMDLPLINEQPASQSRSAGDATIFRVAAVSPGPMTYQWFRNGVPLANGGSYSGVDTPELRISNTRGGDVGTYHVRIGNGCGSTSSAAAVLTVDGALQIFLVEDTVFVTWSSSGAILQEAEDLNGPWTDLPNATSPYFPSGGPAKFYRLKLN